VPPGAEPAPPVGTAGPVLRAVGLEVGYGLPVCAPITLELSAGECVAVLGPNGSGKSTFLLSVVGLRPPLGGSLEVLGAAVDERAAGFRTAVSSALGDDAFFPALTVREHLLLTAYGHGVAAPDEAVDDLLAEFGLAGRAEALPSALSSGQRRRLVLAAALARPRSLLVLDEPEQRLDAGMRRRLADRLQQECADGGAVLFACHDAELVGAAASSALLLTETAAEVVPAADGAVALGRL
jgi:ABC-type multidrug transport system ATPase subunit